MKRMKKYFAVLLAVVICCSYFGSGVTNVYASSYQKTIKKSFTNLKQDAGDTKTKGYTTTLYTGTLTVKSDCKVKVTGKNVYLISLTDEEDFFNEYYITGKHKGRSTCSFSKTIKMKKGTYEIRTSNNGLAQGKKASLSFQSDQKNLKLSKTGIERGWFAQEIEF